MELEKMTKTGNLLHGTYKIFKSAYIVQSATEHHSPFSSLPCN